VDGLAAKKQNEAMRIRVQVALAAFLCLLIASVPARAQERSLGAIGVGDEDCIRITEIISGSPAETAGLAVGDILTTIDGEPTKRITGKFELTTSKNLGSRLLVSYLREGEQGTAMLIVRTWAQITTSAPIKPTAPAKLTAPAKPTVTREQTTLFGYTLGQPEPDEPEDNELVDLSDYNAGRLTVDTVGDEPHGKVGRLLIYWRPEMCGRAQAAVKDKFGLPSVSSWRGVNGFGIPISGTIWTWHRKNGDVIQWARPDSAWWPDCKLHAWTAEFLRKQPKEKDHL
jgi:PDZ domain